MGTSMISVLFTNIIFSERTGTEVATLELAQALRGLGHRVAVFSPTLGETAVQARMLGVPVTSRIETIGFVPDVIHGHHNVALAIAMIRFPDTPAVFVCHDTANPFDQPLLLDRIGLYVAVDAACRDRLVVDGVDPSRIAVMPNGVDLARFSLRTTWPERPRSALLIVKQRIDHVALVTEACQSANIPLEVVGPGVGKVVADLPERCRQADVVFAHSRSAIEAVAVGAAVIVIDALGFGGSFGRDQVLHWPETSLSRRILSAMPTAEALAQIMATYDPIEVREVAMMLRSRVDLALLAREWGMLYAWARTYAVRSHAHDAKARSTEHGAMAAFVAQYMPHADQTTQAGEAHQRALVQEKSLQRCLGLLQVRSGIGFASIDFQPHALGHMLLGHGWHYPEAQGVWSASDRAELWLPEAVLFPWNFEFTVVCARYLPPGMAIDDFRVVKVSIGGCLVTTWLFTPESPAGPELKRIEIPDDLRPGQGRSVLLEFHIDRPISPVEAGENTDRRLLGMRLTAIEAVNTGAERA